jgi:hypothetical protein
MWLYPLPPVLALLGFAYLVVSRVNSASQVALAVVVALVGTAVFLIRTRRESGRATEA